MVIAERTLYVDVEGADVEVMARLFAPVFEVGSWSCLTEIHWPDGVQAFTAYGFDAMQAIYLGLEVIGIHLYLSDEHKSGRLRWGDPGKGYGFPVPYNLREDLIGDDAHFAGVTRNAPKAGSVPEV
ncbi:hypothetical protein [Xanthobacter sp.]|uniref:DUF6968 family protein n=1 Tax=Xanthobacter sp. TaxID=35809 RepID=UPI002600E527|nr:hypothetical protein [Xanthobacter sp.]